MVEIQQISKSFGPLKVLDQIDLTLAPGHVYGLRGRNGAGKTTLMNLILGLCSPDQGTVRVLGKDPEVDWKIRQSIGVLQEGDAYFPELTVKEFLWWVGRLRGLTDAQAEEQARGLAEQFYLTPKLDRLVKTLSYGMTRKTLLAAVFMAKPQLILMDEPSNGLDMDSMESLSSLLIQHRENGGTALVISHNPFFMQAFSSDVLELADGKLNSVQEL